MKFSKKSEYAMRALVHMARHPGLLYTIPKITAAEQIPQKFLEQILLQLRQAGLLNSRRGAGGGYTLKQEPSLIRLIDVVQYVDGEHAILPGEARAPSGNPVDIFLLRLEQENLKALRETTIADLLALEAAQLATGNFDI